MDSLTPTKSLTYRSVDTCYYWSILPLIHRGSVEQRAGEDIPDEAKHESFHFPFCRWTVIAKRQHREKHYGHSLVLINASKRNTTYQALRDSFVNIKTSAGQFRSHMTAFRFKGDEDFVCSLKKYLCWFENICIHITLFTLFSQSINKSFWKTYVMNIIL